MLSPREGSTSVLLVRALLAGAMQAGLSPDKVSAETGISSDLLDPKVLADPDARLPARVALALWETLPRLTGNANFGLWLAQLVGAAPLTAASWFILSSASVGDGLARAVQFQRLLHDHAQGELQKLDDGLRYVHRVGDRSFRAPRDAIEYGFAQLLLLVRRATGTEVFPAFVQFQHPAPPNLDLHRQLFGRDLRFSAETDEIAFDRRSCELSTVTRDDALGEVMLAHARLLLERLPSDVSWTGRVRRTVAEQLPQRILDVESVSTLLALTKRTLQRRLADEGTSFEAIVDELRRGLAERYLIEQRLSLQETAFLLGYSDLSAFHRAFTRWYGQSPAEYRSSRSRASAT